jgi:hypothetical protein
MYSIRDALLSPMPKGASDLMKVDDAAHDQQQVRDCIARGEIEGLRLGAFSNRTRIIIDRYCGGDGVDSLEGYIHSIWYSYYQLSRVVLRGTPEQDRLVLDIIRIQGLGPLTRPVSGNYGIVDIARTVEGTLWNDLPFLATDMTDFWITNCATLSRVQRLNFASFLAKLASTRASNHKVCQIALVLFRSTFEEERMLCHPNPEKQEEEDPSRIMQDLGIADLLPAACAWIQEASHNLIQLSDVFWNDCPSTIGQGGQRFVQSELGMRSPTGFTPWRWMYWLKRLHEIRDEAQAQEADSGQLIECIADTIDRMTNMVKDSKSGILQVYQSGGHSLHQDPHLVCLARETLHGGE